MPYNIANYSSASTILYWFDYKTNVTFNVPLYRSINNQNRFFYGEYNSYNGARGSTLDLNWWIKIRIKLDENTRYEYKINNHELYQFMQALQTVKSYLIDSTDDNPAFYQIAETGEIVINNNIESVIIINSFGDSLELFLSVLQDESDQYQTGVGMIINKSTEYQPFISTNDFLNFCYMMERLNPTQMAISILNLLALRTISNWDYTNTEFTANKNQARPASNTGMFERLGAVER